MGNKKVELDAAAAGDDHAAILEHKTVLEADAPLQLLRMIDFVQE